jgi:hypothetical protein
MIEPIDYPYDPFGYKRRGFMEDNFNQRIRVFRRAAVSKVPVKQGKKKKPFFDLADSDSSSEFDEEKISLVKGNEVGIEIEMCVKKLTQTPLTKYHVRMGEFFNGVQVGYGLDFANELEEKKMPLYVDIEEGNHSYLLTVGERDVVRAWFDHDRRTHFSLTSESFFNPYLCLFHNKRRSFIDGKGHYCFALVQDTPQYVPYIEIDILQNSRKVNTNPDYEKKFHQTQTPHEIHH